MGRPQVPVFYCRPAAGAFGEPSCRNVVDDGGAGLRRRRGDNPRQDAAALAHWILGTRSKEVHIRHLQARFACLGCAPPNKSATPRSFSSRPIGCARRHRTRGSGRGRGFATWSIPGYGWQPHEQARRGVYLAAQGAQNIRACGDRGAAPTAMSRSAHNVTAAGLRTPQPRC